jgi:hypothetical protein
MAPVLTVPHLIHIGLPKTGSTFLQDWFESHPQIAYAKGAIAGFQNVWRLAELAVVPNPDWRCRVTSAESLSCPLSVPPFDAIGPHTHEAMQSAQEAVCNTLKALFPDAFILIVTRGFGSILRSGYSQFLRTGGDLSAETLLPDLVRVAKDFGLYDYDRISALYRGQFGARTIVLPYELLRDNQVEFLEQIGQPLGLDPFEPGREAINASLSAAQIRWYPGVARLFAKIPIQAARRWLLAQHRWRAERGGWSKLVALLERAAGPSPALPDFAGEELACLAPLAAQLRQEPAFRAYVSEYLG